MLSRSKAGGGGGGGGGGGVWVCVCVCVLSSVVSNTFALRSAVETLGPTLFRESW